ncbi:cell division protein FtsQ/DivIB [Propionibacterium australiense]|uniref:POTRA domain profile n=1 Tax=Propionibacterium australiense TaxID=119981 RepID=A0A383S3S4_9ACTN|nr:FtsQ-type POTRA domain-containing protein [Propionibacterium australiense]RLP12502.1 FtsQ-type POTRA domain-containing protein [Propionibacterium australiense]SYZ32678.1 POTRA domain profile [Propionibacterium australiense]VEH91572.1 cell division protein FtsQ [Propionibacterium australiense]
MSSDLDQALRVRQQARARRRNRRITLGALIALVLAGLVWLVGFSPLLVVDDVEVTGTALTSPDDVVAAAAVPTGTPLARVDAGAVTGRVEQLTTVADARLVRAWPRTVRIEITERTAVYQIAQDPGYGQVDAEGVVFVTSTERAAAPLATLADADDQDLRADVATATNALPQDMRDRLTAIEAGSMDSISFRIDDDRTTIFWGSAEQSGEKASVIEALLAQGGDYTTYDVSAPSRPAVS